MIALLTVIPGAPLQDPETGRVIGDSPFMDSLIVIIALIFFAAGPGLRPRRGDDQGQRRRCWRRSPSPGPGLASLLFLFLLIAQFIAYFNFSNMAQVAAVQLGDVLEQMDIGAVWLLIGFIIVTMVVDLIMPAAIAKWAILAPIFIPLLIRLERDAADRARGLPRRRLAAERGDAADGVLPADRGLRQALPEAARGSGRSCR